jgi:hypothetical protein
MGMLNNRELASTILLLGCLTAVVLRREMRGSVAGVIRSALAPKLALLWAAYAGCLGGAVLVIGHFGLRYDGSTKDAVVWALIAGLPIVFRFDRAARQPGLLVYALVGAIKWTTLVEFFVNLYVLPLWAELPLQALLTFVALIAATAETVANAPLSTRRFLNGVVAVGGGALLLATTVHVVVQWGSIDWRATGLAFLQPMVLTIAVVLFTTVVGLLSAYELLFLRLQFPRTAGAVAARHRLALVLGLHLRLTKISGFAGALTVRLRSATSLGSALAVVRDYRRGVLHANDWPDAA